MKAQTETMCETQNRIVSLSISGKDGGPTETDLVQSAAETMNEGEAKESDSTYFIPWRNHLQETEEPEILMQQLSSPEEKLSVNPATPPENQEDQPVKENMPETEGNLPTCFANGGVAVEDSSTLVGEVKHAVECADHSVQVFKESFGILKECCDNMCVSMWNLQIVLETLITILRE